MVHLDKVEGTRGSMVMQDDGGIISSTGTLSSSEQTAQTILALLNHSLHVDFNNSNQDNHQANGVNNTGDNANNAEAANANPAPVLKWNRLTVTYPTHSYVACLSNKKIHIVDRDCTTGEAAGAESADAVNNDLIQVE